MVIVTLLQSAAGGPDDHGSVSAGVNRPPPAAQGGAAAAGTAPAQSTAATAHANRIPGSRARACGFTDDELLHVDLTIGCSQNGQPGSGGRGRSGEALVGGQQRGAVRAEEPGDQPLQLRAVHQLDRHNGAGGRGPDLGSVAGRANHDALEGFVSGAHSFAEQPNLLRNPAFGCWPAAAGSHR